MEIFEVMADGLMAMVDIAASNVLLTVVLGVWMLSFYARPVSIVERANLLVRAEGSEMAVGLARSASRKRYLPYFAYEELLRRIDSIVRRERAEAIVMSRREWG